MLSQVKLYACADAWQARACHWPWQASLTSYLHVLILKTQPYAISLDAYAWFKHPRILLGTRQAATVCRLCLCSIHLCMYHTL